MAQLLLKITRRYKKQYPDFVLNQTMYSTDLQINLSILEHTHTKALVYHFENQDQNCAFAALAQTLPKDNKGCPHILEHTVCCGSNKYPIRDPFFNMLRRSVNSYMNAWTGEDFTCYPFSTANRKDYSNLFNVYLDMVFNPLLNELDFKQEGWRYEFNQNNVKVYKGIVLNQMKGAYQNSERELMIYMQRNLLSKTPYEFDSGGIPTQIVNLSYEELKQMHKYYYHPSNMSFYFYGKIEINSYLQYLKQNYLNRYNYKQYNHPIIIKPELAQQYSTIFSKTAETNSICIGYYLGTIETISQTDKIFLTMLSYFLLETNQAEFYQQYIENGVAETFGISGFNYNKLCTFILTLKGVSQHYSQQQFLKSFISKLDEIATKGINSQRIQEYSSQYQMDILTPKKNNGIKILENFMPIFNHRVSIQSIANSREYLFKAKQILKSKKNLKNLFEKYFFNNKHFTIVRQLQDKIKQHKQQQLFGLNIEQSVIQLQQQQLQQRQQIEQNINILPSLNLQDIKPKIFKKVVQVDKISYGNSDYHKYHILIDQKINFYKFIFRIESIDEQFLKKVDLWMYTINKGIGAGKYNSKQFSSKINSIASNFQISLASSDKEQLNLVISIACLPSNKQELFQLIGDLIRNPKYQANNLSQIYRSYSNDMINSLTSSPLTECLDLCSSTLTKKGYIFNKFYQIIEGIKITNGEVQINQFKSMHENMLHLISLEMVEHSNIQNNQRPKFVDQVLLNKSIKSHNLNYQSKFEFIAVTHNYDVSYCTQQFIGPQILSKNHAYASLLLEILQNKYLHPQIREKGGAYGARALIRQNGLICLYSYMDPSPKRTFEVFNQSISNLLSLPQIPQKLINQAKLLQLAQIDKPIPPQQEGLSRILGRYQLKKLLDYRQFIRLATSEQILDIGKKYLTKRYSRAVFGHEFPQNFHQIKLEF